MAIAFVGLRLQNPRSRQVSDNVRSIWTNVYTVYCEPGIRERTAWEAFEDRVWNEHPCHAEVIPIGGEAVP